MRKTIDPTVSTFLDVCTGEFRDDAGLEQRMFEAIVACIEHASGNPDPLRRLFAMSRQLRREFGERLVIPFDTLHAARTLEPVASAMRQREQETNMDLAIALGMVLGERASLAQHAVKFRMRKGEVQRAVFDGPVRIEPPLSHCVQHTLEAYHQMAETIDIHRALLDSALFMELTGLRWEMREGQFLSRPFLEADLITAGFPTVEERLRYSTSNPKLRV